MPHPRYSGRNEITEKRSARGGHAGPVAAREVGLTLTHRQGLLSSTERARNETAVLRKTQFSADTRGFPPKRIILTTGPVPQFPTWLRPGLPHSHAESLLVMANGTWTHRLHPHGCGFNSSSPGSRALPRRLLRCTQPVNNSNTPTSPLCPVRLQSAPFTGYRTALACANISLRNRGLRSLWRR